MKTVKLAIADDSSFVRKAVQRMLEKETKIRFVGAAATGEELLGKLNIWKPDVITLDLSMPGIGGIETLEKIMSTHPLPVIILSTHSAKDAPLTIEALHKGAVDFIDKQKYSLLDFDSLRTTLVQKILEASAARVTAAIATTPRSEPASENPMLPACRLVKAKFEVLVIGASTGGPPAIQAILESLGKSVAVPIVIVQHMPVGFTKAFAERLDANLPFKVMEARHGEELIPGVAYIAPTGHHLRIHLEKDRPLLALTSYPDTFPHKPSIDVLFESTARIFGSKALAVILTGMGKDGAEGMMDLKKSGAYTIGQNEATCVVYGMPRAAKMLGAVSEQLPLQSIGARIIELLNIEDHS